MRTGSQIAKRPRDATPLDKLVFVHIGALLLFISWAFGGQAPWARQIIAWWGTIGILLFGFVCLKVRRADTGKIHPALRYLWPLWLYDLMVIVSCFNPGFREIVIVGQPSLVMGDPNPWLPSAALPHLALKELWQFNGLLLGCFNLFLVFRRRGQIRGILFLLAGNAVALAIFGTFQKLTGATGLWFGLVESPNDHFFSTFIYHNHWGAFTLLNTVAALALLFHYERHSAHRDIWHSPVLLGAMGTLLLALSVPLSTSRSSTALIGMLLAGALVHFLLRVIRRRREKLESTALPVAGVILAALLAMAAVGYLGRDILIERTRLTAEQLDQFSQEGTLTARLVLYRDTWRMASEKTWFGWGLESYAHVFRVFNTQRTAESQWWIVFYAEAHNDWLQSLAEVGFVGTGLLALLALLPILSIKWRRVRSVVPLYLLAGCTLLLLYAFLEFPFANPAVMLTFCTVFYCAIRYAELDVAATKHV